MEEEQEIELRSEEVQEILTRPPSWMIRWGSLVVLFLIALVLVFSYFIKYPDVVSSTIIITTQTPPEKVVAKTSGRIEKIFIQNMQTVEAKTPLAIIENSASYVDVFKLKKCLDSLDLQALDFPYYSFEAMRLGDMQGAYAAFEKDYITFDFNRKLHPHSIEFTAKQRESAQLKERYALLKEQSALEKKELDIKEEALERDENLFQQGIISKEEWETKKLDYLQITKRMKGLLTQLSQAQSSINELHASTDVAEVTETINDVNRIRNVYQSLAQLNKAIQDWELAYVITSSVRGKVSFMQVWGENQTIEAGQQVFIIVPEVGLDFIGKLKAPANSVGKVKVGQQVNIRLENYPANEFGVLIGTVASISLTPDQEGNMLIDVTLPNGIKTSYDRTIEFQQEMAGSAEIITQDLRLIERFFHQFKDVLKR